MILHDAATIARYTDGGWWGQVTIEDMFQACLKAAPNQIALIDAPNRASFAYGEPRTLTFTQIDQTASNLAADLFRHGVRKDSVVVVQLPNIVEIVIAFLACARLGAIVSPIMLAYGERDVRRIVNHLRPTCFLTLAMFKGQSPSGIAMRICGEAVGFATTVLTLGEPHSDKPTHITDLLSLTPDLAPMRAYLKELRVDANDIVTMHWTSGTTGDPKCVPRSINNWHATGTCCTDAGGLQHGDRILAPMQMVHTAGYSGLFMPWLETQGTLVLHHPFDMNIYLDQLETLRINHTVAAPAMLNALLNDNVLDNHDVSAIRSILCGSAPLDSWMIEGFKTRYGIEIINAFGSTEGLTMLSSPTITTDPHRRARYFPRFRGTTGRSSTGASWGVRIAGAVETKIIDLETGAEINTPHTPGEFAFRSSALFPGYWTADHTLDRSDFDAEGFFRTGEIFEIAGTGDDADYYHYIDRLKDVINRGGVKIPVGELESAIQSLPHVREAAAVGYPDPKLGERICAAVTMAPGHTLTLQDLNAGLTGLGIAKFMLPERLELVTTLPRNATGKILKRDLVRSLSNRA
ncbi:MAG: acyl--CoA ligase [Rhodospirillaceae bacterium]|nr:acyl--CoA ligase [Rhodospirillaceae bacterium]